jgi:biotin carboxyl carrier protein
MAISYHAEAEFSAENKDNLIFVEGSSIIVGKDAFIVHSLLEYPSCYEMINQSSSERHIVIATKTHQGIDISLNGYTYSSKVSDNRQYEYGTIIKSGAASLLSIVKVNAPMPGLLKVINVTIGQTVKKGEVIFVLEAMKMENALKSPINGIIKEINVKEGSAIEKGFVLCTIGPIE